MINDVLAEAEGKMHKAVEALRRELASIRTGRAQPGLVEHLRLDYYGVPTPLNQVATVTVPEARLLVIQPYEKNMIGVIEKAILKSDLGLTPASDGRVIRLPIPQLTEDRRKELIRMTRKKVEEGRVILRNLRRDAAEALKDTEKKKDISEDDLKRALEQLQKLTDVIITDADKVGQEKEAELMEI
ncbi:MAG: ribosome recycling factor [Chloroflexi bacterium]|nr:ribosome recycling factor [Chloroflexota bacterium]